MLSSKEQKRSAEEVSLSSNVIGNGTSIKGDLETKGNLRIEGKIVGHVISQAKVAIGNSGLIEGNITSINADIEGTINGNLEVSELLVLKSSSKVYGDITTVKLVIEPGAVFNGACKMQSDTIKKELRSNVKLPYVEIE